MSSDDASSDLGSRVRAWIDDDPDPTTAAELTALLARAEVPAQPSSDHRADPVHQRARQDAEIARAELEAELGIGPEVRQRKPGEVHRPSVRQPPTLPNGSA